MATQIDSNDWNAEDNMWDIPADAGGAIPTPEAGDAGKVPVANNDGTASWQTPSGGGAPVTITNASFISDVTSFLTALMTASTDTAIRVKRGVTMNGDEELFEALKSIHENGSPLDLTLLGYSFRVRPVFSQTYMISDEPHYYAQFVNEFFQYSSNYKLAYEIYASKSTVGYHYQLGMTCVKMTVLT